MTFNQYDFFFFLMPHCYGLNKAMKCIVMLYIYNCQSHFVEIGICVHKLFVFVCVLAQFITLFFRLQFTLMKLTLLQLPAEFTLPSAHISPSTASSRAFIFSSCICPFAATYSVNEQSKLFWMDVFWMFVFVA